MQSVAEIVAGVIVIAGFVAALVTLKAEKFFFGLLAGMVILAVWG